MKKRNLILVGKAEEIPVPPRVAEMIANQGFYICGSQGKEAEVPVVSLGGRLYSMRIDEVLSPHRFLEDLIASGPFRLGDVIGQTLESEPQVSLGIDEGKT